MTFRFNTLMTKTARRTAVSLVFAMAAAAGQLLASCSSSNPAEPYPEPDEQPGGNITVPAEDLMEVKTPSGLRQQMVEYTGMTVSFNRDTHDPNYVVWELTREEANGTVPRTDNFMADENVPGSALPTDYRNSGYDRGHMAPAGDMKWHVQAMRESFYMTNMCPQSPDLNRGAWEKLEEKCRTKAREDESLIIICGPIFDKSGPAARIGQTGVAVPQRFFKVILAPKAERPYAIGFIMPNGYVEGGMQEAAVSVDEVEAATGYDFFSALPDDTEELLESRCDFQMFSRSSAPRTTKSTYSDDELRQLRKLRELLR